MITFTFHSLLSLSYIPRNYCIDSIKYTFRFHFFFFFFTFENQCSLLSRLSIFKETQAESEHLSLISQATEQILRVYFSKPFVAIGCFQMFDHALWAQQNLDLNAHAVFVFVINLVEKWVWQVLI